MSDFDETLNEEELNIITLTDEDGTDKDFEFLDLIDLDDKEYVVLLPVESEDENADGEVIILEVHPLDEENEEYLSIEDATTLNKVFEVFKEDSKTILILSINSYEGNGEETVIPPLNHSFLLFYLLSGAIIKRSDGDVKISFKKHIPSALHQHPPIGKISCG